MAVSGSRQRTVSVNGWNAVAFVVVLTVGFLLALVGSNVFTDDGSIAEVYLTLIATTPLTGRMLLWVSAPTALTGPTDPEST